MKSGKFSGEKESRIYYWLLAERTARLFFISTLLLGSTRDTGFIDVQEKYDKPIFQTVRGWCFNSRLVLKFMSRHWRLRSIGSIKCFYLVLRGVLFYGCRLGNMFYFLYMVHWIMQGEVEILVTYGWFNVLKYYCLQIRIPVVITSEITTMWPRAANRPSVDFIN